MGRGRASVCVGGGEAGWWEVGCLCWEGGGLCLGACGVVFWGGFFRGNGVDLYRLESFAWKEKGLELGELSYTRLDMLGMVLVC